MSLQLTSRLNNAIPVKVHDGKLFAYKCDKESWNSKQLPTEGLKTKYAFNWFEKADEYLDLESDTFEIVSNLSTKHMWGHYSMFKPSLEEVYECILTNKKSMGEISQLDSTILDCELPVYVSVHLHTDMSTNGGHWQGIQGDYHLGLATLYFPKTSEYSWEKVRAIVAKMI